MTTDEIARTIAELAAGIKGSTIREKDWALPLEEVDIDSLDLASLLLAVEEKFDVKIPDADVPELPSIRAMAEYVSRCKGSA